MSERFQINGTHYAMDAAGRRLVRQAYRMVRQVACLGRDEARSAVAIATAAKFPVVA